MTIKNKIWLGPADGSNAKALLVEGQADDAIIPGSLVERTSTGLATSDNVATVFNSEVLVAIEEGSHRGGTVTTPYTVGDVAMAAKLRSGEFVLVRVAAAQNITVTGTPLSSNGDGTAKIALTDGTEQILLYAEEVINTGGSVALVVASKA